MGQRFAEPPLSAKIISSPKDGGQPLVSYKQNARIVLSVFLQKAEEKP